MKDFDYDKLQELGKTTAESLAEMVAALNVNYERLEELRGEREGFANDSDRDEAGEDAAKARATWACLNPADAEELAELESAAGDCEDEEDARRRIEEDPLEVTARSTWQPTGEPLTAAEFCILLSTGGPATRIIGEMNESGEPTRARIECQDWFLPWTEYRGDAISQDDLLTYCGHFIFPM